MSEFVNNLAKVKLKKGKNLESVSGYLDLVSMARDCGDDTSLMMDRVVDAIREAYEPEQVQEFVALCRRERKRRYE